MESIRILQNTYEMLYAITPVLGNFMEQEFDNLDPFSWQDKYVNSFLQKKKKRIKWEHLKEIDLYYLLAILSERWVDFKQHTNSSFFTDENRLLFIGDVKENKYSIINIRNEVSHPEYWNYEMSVYAEWKESLELAAKKLGSNIPKLLNELHTKEKNRLLKFIETKVILPALESDKIKEDIKDKIRDTHERLKVQTTAAGIIYFFEDALRASGGKTIGKILETHDLNSFEKIQDAVLNSYYGIKKIQ